MTHSRSYSMLKNFESMILVLRASNPNHKFKLTLGFSVAPLIHLSKSLLSASVTKVGFKTSKNASGKQLSSL
jgi:hypothetical protein